MNKSQHHQDVAVGLLLKRPSNPHLLKRQSRLWCDSTCQKSVHTPVLAITCSHHVWAPTCFQLFCHSCSARLTSLSSQQTLFISLHSKYHSWGWNISTILLSPAVRMSAGTFGHFRLEAQILPSLLRIMLELFRGCLTVGLGPWNFLADSVIWRSKVNVFYMEALSLCGKIISLCKNCATFAPIRITN